MSLFRLPALRSIASKVGNLRDRLGFGRPSRSITQRAFRHLLVDPLEQRQLLSLSPMGPYDNLVNQTFGGLGDMFPSPSQQTIIGQAVACDDDGDFVVTWQRYDQVFDPDTSSYVTDANIYARYFTDEVQRITLPTELTTDTLGSAFGTFSLRLGGNEVQKISVTSTYTPYAMMPQMQTTIMGSFSVGLDVNGDGIVAGNESFIMDFDEYTPLANAQAMQDGLQSLGGRAADAQVRATSTQDYYIEFGAASGGEDMPEIVINPSDVNFISGFFPGILVSTERQPITISDILLNPTDANATATKIENRFAETMQAFYLGPTFFPVNENVGNNIEYPYMSPAIAAYSDWRVSVRPVNKSLTQFDITFVGAAGKTDHPEMVITSAKDEYGNSHLASPTVAVATIKEPSPEFRVNDPEPYDPYWGVTARNQTTPAVAMDNDGDFVITWQGETATDTYDTNTSDIFARRFKPAGWVETPGFVQSVVPLGNQFLVNTTTNGLQDQATVGMDRDGNFTIAWVSTGQDVSYFNQVSAQRYDRDGGRLGSEFVVMGLGDTLDTSIHHDPYVSMSDEGHLLFTWSETDDPYYAQLYPYGAILNARLMLPGTDLDDEWLVNGVGGDSTSSWSAGGEFLITWDEMVGSPSNIPGAFLQSYGEIYSVVGTDFFPIPDRSTFRINSADFNPGTKTAWPGDQGASQAMLDADGDVVGVYEGYGADASEAALIDTTYFYDLINSQKNADLLPYLMNLMPVASTWGETPSAAGGNGDIDAEIEQVLINAWNTGATSEQIGRLRALLDIRGSLLRGDASGVFFSRFDAATNDNANEVSSECIVSAERDGHNTRYIIMVDSRVTGGAFTLRLSHALGVGNETITITPPLSGDPAVIDPNLTAREIETELERAIRAGNNWPDTGDAQYYDGPVEVRRVDGTEWSGRASTPWAWPTPGNANNVYMYEITFQGECHDLYMGLSPASGKWNKMKVGSADAADPEIYLYESGEPGLIQNNAAAAIQPDGDFVVVWTQWEETTNILQTNSNICFREFNESTDTAGPRMTDMLLTDGARLPNGGQVTSTLTHLIVTFDEELSTSGASSVLNLANWSLLKDGASVSGGISNIKFGLNMAKTMGLSAVGSNKWEAVLTLDGNGVTAGTPALGGGQYEIRISNNIHDRMGNPLGRTGQQIQGQPATRSFYLTPPTGGETPVNSQTSGSQTSANYSDIIDPAAVPSSPQSIAGDADGEYVVVWTDEGTDAGIRAKVCRTEWTKSGSTRVSNTVTLAELLVTDDPTASHASVARDADGDFVVTWSQYDAVTGWDVWFRRYDAQGRAQDVARMANTETELAQRFSAVAMDNDGDFVITWQSEGQDGNGYGIYAQRFSRTGEILDGVDEIQVLSLVGEVTTATFTLDLDGQITGQITYSGDLAYTAERIEQEFALLGITVETELLNERDIAIQFLGSHGRRNISPLVLNTASVVGDADADLVIAMGVEGISSEFRVNDTVGGNQVFPSVAMDAEGSYIISWTSFGQDGDAADDSNIYAKRFEAGDEFVSPTQRLARLAERWNWEPQEGVEVKPYMVTVNPPDFYIVPPGSGYDGIVMLGLDRSDGFGIGSGTLLTTGYHILTAAHNVCDDNGNLVANNVQVVFGSPTGLPGDTGGPTIINSSAIYVLPGYTGAPWAGGADLAVIVLETRAPDAAERWDIYREGDEVGQDFLMFGYGRSGMGGAGGDVFDVDGWMRYGWNTWEATGEMLAQVLGEHYSSEHLLSDFDDPAPHLYDTFGTIFGMPHTGLGTSEASSAPGDSGGPCFIGNKIAGVVSYGIVIGQPDPWPGLNSSYSDISADQRVSIYADWIDAMTLATPEFLVNTSLVGDQKWSSVAMDTDGDYVITWTGYGQDGTGSGYGPGVGGVYAVHAQRYTSGNIPVAGEIQVNTYTDGNQQRSQVDMDADGDFIIAWESFQDRPTGAGSDTGASYGIYAQRYAANSKMNDEFMGVDGRVGNEFRVNTTTEGDQRYPSVFMSDAGDAVVAWAGAGTGDSQGLFTQRFEVLADKAGPVVTDVVALSPTGTATVVVDGDTVTSQASRAIVRFGENISTAYSTNGPDSVLNPNNWSLTRYGETIGKGVRTIEFGLSLAYTLGYDSVPSGKYEAILTLDGDPATSGAQALGDGSYVLTLSSNVQDLFANRLDGNYDGAPGGNFNHSFLIQTAPVFSGDLPVVGPSGTVNPRTHAETPNAIAADADGDHVIVWTASVLIAGEYRDRVYGQRYDSNGTAVGSPFWITEGSAATYGNDDQRHASVAMDADGDFVVTWTNYRDTDGNTANGLEEVDIYARRYQANGTAQGAAFRVNLYTENTQIWSDVAMDLDGDFVVTWSSMGQEDNQQLGYGYGVYARRFDSFGASMGIEFHVNVTEVGNQQFPSIAMDATGDFMITWTSDQAIDGTDIIARAFKADGSPMPIDNSLVITEQLAGIHGGEILVNTTTAGDQRYSDVAMDHTGQYFTVAWSSSGKDTSGFGVYARRLVMHPLGLVVPNPGDPYEFRVNTSVMWNQMYPSVAMEWDGSFIISWSGYGNRPFEPDTSGYGVFYQRYDAAQQVIGDEYRANSQTQGYQWLSSIATDANGNFFLVWTGVGETADSTALYRYLGKTRFPAADTLGPVVTDILSITDRSRLIQDATIESAAGVTQMIFTFNENLSTTGGTSGLDSVTNPGNWSLTRNGADITKGISSISFAYNAQSRKYEAVVTFDSNGSNPGTPGLVKGDYTLTIRDSITDGANRLDGDYDAVPGTVAGGTGMQGFEFHFSVADSPNLGPEYRVNQGTSGAQTASATLGMGMALEGSNRSVAMDHDGDFVVVWTSYGQDDPSDPSGGGVYMRVFDRNNNPLTGDIRVNTFTVGHQRNAEVAMDSDGDFVVVWESEGQDIGGSYGIFGQRFNSMGQPIDGEFRVNTEYMGTQIKPAIAMNNQGDFVVTYVSSYGQDLSYFQEVLGQRFNRRGEPVGVEFQINQGDIPLLPTVADSEVTTNTAVAMDEAGGFVVTWELFDTFTLDDGVIMDSHIVARMFNPDGTPRNDEFRVDVSNIAAAGRDTYTDGEHREHQSAVDTIGPWEIQRTARNPQIAMDGQGNFTIVWESWRDNDIDEDTNNSGDSPGRDPADWPDSYGIYFHQFNLDGTRRTEFDYNANFVNTQPTPNYDPNFTGAQVNPSVALDLDGDFSVVWNGLGAEPGQVYPSDPDLLGSFDATGVFIRNFHTNTGGNTAGYTSVQQRVNYTTGGSQQFPTLVSEPDGDLLVVWSGAGVGDQHGLFFRRYNEAADTAGPLVTDLQANGVVLENGAQVIDTVQTLVVTFDEDLTRTGVNGVLNLSNWSLLKNGVQLTGGITNITFGLNPATNKWEAVLTLDGNGSTSGAPALSGGYYEVIVSNAVRDAAGNALGRAGYAKEGASASRTFYIVPPTGGQTTVNTNTAGDQIFLDPTAVDPDMVPNSPRSIAGDADADHVVVWTSTEPTTAGVWAKICRTVWTGTGENRTSNPTPSVIKEFRITPSSTASYASVAQDGDGDFIVTWQEFNAATGWDVYFQRFDSMGNAIDATPRMANGHTQDDQRYASVAMDIDGDFVVAWQSDGQDGSGYGVYAQAYSRTGEVLGGVNEIQTLTFPTTLVSTTFKLEYREYDEDGTQISTQETADILYDGDLETTASRIENALIALGITVEVEVLNETDIAIQFVGDHGQRDVAPLVVHQDGPSVRIQHRVVTEGEGSEFRVNDTTAGDQLFPSVAMDSQGSYVVSWTSFGQGGDAANESNIYAKRFASGEVLVSGGNSLKNLATTQSGGPVAAPRVIASGDDHTELIVDDGTGYDGVVQVFAGGGSGTGSLLLSGYHILTAAHVVADDFGNALPASVVSVAFTLPTGIVYLQAQEVFVHPAYNGSILDGNDVAVIVLAGPAPVEAERYDIYRGSDELGKAFARYGYGLTGVGETGEDLSVDTTYVLRGGENVYEALGSVLGIHPGILVYDFDDGTAEHDALGVGYNIVDMGLEDERETNSARGDSGGPAFINGLIAGITSGGYINSAVAGADVNDTLDSSFGEISIDARISAYAGWIDAIVGGSSPEFLVNTTITGDQKWSSVAMDLDGDYVITWTTHNQNGTENGPGGGFIDQNAIMARRFNSDNTAVGAEFQANTYEAENQQHSQVAMDADGDFMITWESFQESGAAATSYGVYAQRFAGVDNLSTPYLGVNGRIGTEIHVNTVTAGDQRMPSVLLSHAGDAIIVWTGPGANGIDVFTQRYNMLADKAGPVVTDVLIPGAALGVSTPILDGAAVSSAITELTVIFGEELNTQYATSGPKSILNLNNWELTRDGEVVAGAIVSITFGRNPLTNKYEAVVEIDGDPATDGLQPLPDGVYVLTIKDTVADIHGNALDGNYDGTPGGSYSLTFTVLASGTETRVNTDPDGKQVFMDETLPINQTPNGPQSVAADADGDYGVVWVDQGHVTEEVQTLTFGSQWGKFALQYGSQKTGDITYADDAEATAEAIKAALTLLGLETDVVKVDDTTIKITFVGTSANTDHSELDVVPPVDSQHDISATVNIRTDIEGGATVTGVFVKLYDVLWSVVDGDERSSTLTERTPINPGTGIAWANHEIRVTANATATYASIAMDADGDFVVTWSQNDGTTAAPDWNVYAQRYDAMGNPLGNEFRVNAETKLAQRYSSVAIDHDGDFVITWQSEAQDGNGYEVYAQTYDRFGKALGVLSEQQVLMFSTTSNGTFKLVYKNALNQETSTGAITYNGDLAATALAIQTELTALGLEVEVIAQAPTDIEIRFIGKDAGKNHKQLLLDLSMPGAITGLTAQTQQDGVPGEFRVNQNTEGDQVHATVTMDARGNFVIAWTSYDTNASDADVSNVYARQFAWIDNENRSDTEDQFAAGNEFLVNQSLDGEQRWADVAMDIQGDFVVTWTSVLADPNNLAEQVGAVGTQDVFARRYLFQTNLAGTAPVDNVPFGDEFRVNSFTRGTQQHSSVTMDADGDFVITWESFQDVPNPSSTQPNSFGVYAQAYVRNELVAQQGGNGEIGEERAINGTKVGAQRLPSVALDDTGDIVIVWSGRGEVPGQEDTQGIFMVRQEMELDVAGPTVTDVLYVDESVVPAERKVVLNNGLISSGVTQLVVVFSEDLNTVDATIGAHSVMNPEHWQLQKNGKVLEDGITKIEFALNAATGKYEAVLTVDLEALTPGLQPLDNGLYLLTADDAIHDLFGNPLDGNLDGTPGSDFHYQFMIRIGQEDDDPVAIGSTDPETPGAVAVDIDGDYVVAWTASDGTTDRAYFRLYDASGAPKGGNIPATPTAEFPAFATDQQRNVAVAIDADGDFIVTWTNYHDTDNNVANGYEEVDVYARRYNAKGTAVSNPFRVNSYTAGDQKWASVAMDVDGDFVITWSSYSQEDGGQDGSGFGIYARRYDRFGMAYGPEFQVNTTTAGNQQFSSVAMGADGAFVIVWQSDQNGIGDDIIARVFNVDASSVMSPLTGEFTVNDTLAGNQRYPDIAMDLAGESYVVTWSSSQHTDDPSGYGVYTKRFDRLTLDEMNVRYAYSGAPVDFEEGQTVDVPIVVDQNFRIADLNVRLDISHVDPSDLIVSLISPSGQEVFLFLQVPPAGDADGYTLGGPNGANFTGTLFDDEAGTPIEEGLPPFEGEYQPMQALANYDDETSLGTWTLRIRDNDPANDPDVYFDEFFGFLYHEPDGGRLWTWSLEFTRDPAASDEILVNGTTQGNQLYSSVAMDSVGNAVVVWCGYGTEPGQEDTSAYGVFARRLTTTMVLLGTEQRLNVQTAGMQWLPSVDMDGEGNYVAVWTGDTAVPGVTSVFQYLGTESPSIDGPIVTDVFAPITLNGVETLAPVLDGDAVRTGLAQLVVAFGEEMSVAQSVVNSVRTPAVESILNPNNWILERNGDEVIGGVIGVTFGFNDQTGRYEARLTLDGNGLDAQQPGLLPGEYVLVIRDLVRDTNGNALDGDYDALPGTSPDASGNDGYAIHFSVSENGDTLGAERRVNQETATVQILSQPKGTGQARETTTMSVAVDHDGDYVVVWTTYEQDSPFDADVYYRLYDRNNNPITNEARVNNLVDGWQGNATVAMDADGDFVVAWESIADDGTLDVYAQRYTSQGARVANSRTNRIATDPYRNVSGKETIEVLVNTGRVGQQFNPAVSMDSFGNYVVVWGNAGQGFGYLHNIQAQRFSFRGEPIAEEFQVTQADLPGATGPGYAVGFTVNPSVDLGDDGNMVVTWDRMTAATSGVVVNTDVVVRLFDVENNPLIDETIVNADEIISQDGTHTLPDGAAGGTDLARVARNPQVGMDSQGNFIVVFESFLDNDYETTDTPDSYGIYYRRFDNLGVPLTDAIQQANTVVSAADDALPGSLSTESFAGDQVNPTIAVDADGDFAIFWNGNGAQPDQYDPANPELISDDDSAGVFGRWFHAGTAAVLSAPAGAQQRANRTEAGVQQFASVAMEPDGDSIVVWAGSGVGDRHGIFVRRYNETTDTAGPMATELRATDATNTLVGPGDNLFGNPKTLLVVFDEQLNTALTGPGGTPGLHSVENVNNWALVNGRGEEISGVISNVTFAFSATLNKWTAAVTFSGAGLANGTYTLVARTAIQDLAGNALARTGYQPYGTGREFDASGNELPLDPITSPTGGFGFQFRVNNTIPGDAPWGDLDQLVSEPATTLGQDNLALVNYQQDSAVARNASGQYVIVWVEYSEVIDSTLLPVDPNVDPATLPIIPATPVLEANIMAQRFDANCREVGEPILVNRLTVGNQLEPAVAMDDAGNFVVIWSGDGTALGDATGIFGQRFDADGAFLGGQFRVNDYLNSIQDEPAVAMNPNTGDFVVTWTSFGQDGSRDGIIARRYRASGLPYGAEFVVTSYTQLDQATSDIAMDAAGNFVIVWAGQGQDASGWGVFGQRFSAAGARQGSEFHVNTQQNGDQLDPAVARDRKGNFVVTWTSRQDGSGLGVYAQRYNASGVKQGSEFRVNETTIYDQFEPDVAMSPDGIFVVTWTSFNQDTPYDEDLRDWGIYARMYNANGADYIDPRVGTSPIGEFRVNAETDGNQFASSVAMDAGGHYIVSWAGQHSIVTVPVVPPEGQGQGGQEGETGPTEVNRPLTAIYSRYIDPPVSTSSNASTADVSIAGTSGNDTFEFLGGPTPASWIVKLNGVAVSVGAYPGVIRFDGKGGQDTVIFNGSGADDRIELWADHGTFTSSYYTLEVSQVETITAAGGVGNDTAYLHDGSGNDQLTVYPQLATLTGQGLNLTATAFESVHAIADGGGADIAHLYDTTDDDTFTTRPAYAEMTSNDKSYYAKASSFEAVVGYSTAGIDLAVMYDSVGNDKLIASWDYAKLSGAGFSTTAVKFRGVIAYGNAGGSDVATMMGSSGADTFDARPHYATYRNASANTTASFYNRAEDFEVIQAMGNVAEEDKAVLHGSDGNDTFIVGQNYGEMYGPDYRVRADFFRNLTGHGDGGFDTVRFFDSKGNDTFDGSASYSQMYSTDYINRAFGFERVEARIINGGQDVANLIDSAMNDYLEAENKWAQLSTEETGFACWVQDFQTVNAKSNNAGDTKRILPGVDFLYASGQWADE